jgi:tryptophan 7-halogenase
MAIRIVIVGGGTAGWMSAAYLARTLGGGADPVEITLVEASDIGAIGVGEGTFPTIRATLASLGVSEAAFLEGSCATFKQGVLFQGWSRATESYFHPFNLPFRGEADDLSSYWLERCTRGDRVAFADAVTAQGPVVAARLGPKRLEDPDFQGPMNYAYHFDAARFAEFLKGVAGKRGVRRLEGRVLGVERDETGWIRGVQVDGRGLVEGDFFVDCSGFRALLIGEALGSRFTGVGDVLFNDRALAVQVPYDRPDAPIASATIATAHEAGWTWDIGLSNRRGVGYVYSSRHTDLAGAEAVLRAYVGSDLDGLSPRPLEFRTGYREAQWIGNCVAVGLSAGFFEPLESTGIMLIELAARMLVEIWPGTDRGMDRDRTEAAARAFNRHMLGRFQRIVDFLKLHYCLSQRSEPYWRDNADPASLTASLADLLAMWRARPMSRFDFVVDLETFLPASWQYVAYGMGLAAAPGPWGALLTKADAAARAFETVRRAAAEAPRHLPRHRDLVAAYLARAA